MALKRDIITKTKGLENLSDEQIAAIEILSANDEELSIKPRIREVYDELDRDIERESGLRRGAGEKTYDFAKRVIAELKRTGSAAGSEELQNAKRRVAELEEQLKGKIPDEAARNQITTLETRLKEKGDEVAAWQKKYNDEIKEAQRGIKAAMEANVRTKTNYELDRALGGFTFKPEVPEPVLKTFVNAAKTTLTTNFEPEWVADPVTGQERIVWKDKKTGEIARNADNSLQPFTTEELLGKEIASVIAPNRKVEGTGGSGKPAGNPGGGSGGSFALNASNQREAMDQITKHLIERGIRRGTQQFEQEKDTLWKESGAAELPMGERL